jgi:hypothetical protein
MSKSSIGTKTLSHTININSDTITSTNASFINEFISTSMVLPCATALPANPIKGQMIFNATTRVLAVYNGTQWYSVTLT